MRTVVSSRILPTSSAPTRVAMALRMDPCRGVVVPFVSRIRDLAGRRPQCPPTALVLDLVTNGVGDEPAPLALPDELVELAKEFLVQADMDPDRHSVPRLAHWKAHSLPTR